MPRLSNYSATDISLRGRRFKSAPNWKKFRGGVPISFRHPGQRFRLVRHHEMRPAVLLPAGFVMFGAEGTLFPPADRFDPVAGDPK